MGKEQETVGVQEAGAKSRGVTTLLSRREALRYLVDNLVSGVAIGVGSYWVAERLRRKHEMFFVPLHGRYVEGGLAFTKDGSKGALTMEINSKMAQCGQVRDTFSFSASDQKERSHLLHVVTDFDLKEVFIEISDGDYRGEEGVQEVGLRRETGEVQKKEIATSTLKPKVRCLISFDGQDSFGNPVLEMRWKNWEIQYLGLNGQEVSNLYLYRQDKTNNRIFQVRRSMCSEPAPVQPEKPKEVKTI